MPYLSSARRVALFFTLVLLPWSIPWPTQAQAPIDISHDLITTIDLPNAAGAYHATVLADVSANGLIVGGFGFPTHGLQEGSFFLHLPGTAKLFTCGPDVTWTQVRGVNRHGAMAGWCYTRVGDSATVHGFYRSESGKITALRYPGATLTEANDVNDSHIVVGHYVDAQGQGHGFRWTRSSGAFETMDAPFPGAVSTAFFGINNAGDRAGTYHAPLGATHGFLVRGTQWTALDAPGAQVTTAGMVTEHAEVLGISNSPAGNQNFLFAQGTYHPLTVPFQYLWGAWVNSINPAQLVVGALDQAIPVTEETQGLPGPTHGFVAKLQTLQAPDTVTAVAQVLNTRQALRSPDGQAGAALAHPQVAHVQLDGCPDEPVPAGRVRPGRLAMSWSGCARMR